MDQSQTLIATTGIPGSFSEVSIALSPSRKSIPLDGTTFTLRKYYAAFFYPMTDRPAPWPAGTLLRTGDHYALIRTDGKRADFDTVDTVRFLGYDTSAFVPVSPEEFDRNEPAEGKITVKLTDEFENPYPSGTLFVINGVYYQLIGNTLVRFVSEAAYLSRYTPEQAISRDTLFLGRFSLKEDWLGFADGTLLSFDNGIFIVDQNTLHPISDPTTFTALGFDWNHVIQASEEEIGIYTRGRMIVQSSPQPSGTIFADRDTGERYIITADAHKAKIASPTLADILSRGKQPIEVSSRALDISITCAAHVSGIFTPTADCTLPLSALETLPGSSYEITVHTPADGARINTLEADFYTVIRQSSWRDTLSIIKQQILKRYTPTP